MILGSGMIWLMNLLTRCHYQCRQVDNLFGDGLTRFRLDSPCSRVTLLSPRRCDQLVLVLLDNPGNLGRPAEARMEVYEPVTLG